MARMGHVVGICLMAALAVALCASFTVAEHINAPTDTVFVESAATARKEGWFHLDDLLQGTAIDEQKQTATKLPRFREVAPEQESSESGGSSEDSNDDPDKSEEEKSKVIKHKKGGSTTVVKNRNFMSLTEDAKGNELDPAAAAAEARLEAQEQYMKRTAEDSKKRNKEAKVKHGKRSADEQSEKDKKKAAEASKKSAVEEVRKAQEGTNKVNNKRREQYTKRRAMEQKLKKDSNVRLSKEWKHYGYGYAPAMANVSGSRCMVSGLLRGRRGFIGYLPSNCRPGGRIMFSQANGNGLARIDILADGRMYFITGPQQHWISLTGMDFATSGNVDITLKSNWRPYGSSWRKPGVRIESGVCMVSGLVRSGAWSTIASLPDNCRSNERLIFRVCNHRWISRLDIIGNEIRWVGGTKNHGWVALDGISFAPGVGGGSLKLYNNWTNYGSGYRPARIYVNQNVCHVSGLIRNLVDPNFTRKRHITTLPSNCRPKARLIFSTLSSHARLDILPNGSVIYINGKSSKVNWLSLSGIKFYTA